MNQTPDADAAAQTPGVQSPAWPPAGFVDWHGAAAILGVSTRAVKKFELDGALPAGTEAVRPNGLRAVLYAVADLERLRDERAALGARGGLPPGHVGEEEAARLLGVNVPGFLNWIRKG